MTRSSAKKAFLAILTAVLSVAAILLVYLRCTSGEQAFFAAEPPQAAPTISELSPLDGFCPDGLGRCAWIELHNNTDEDFDLSEPIACSEDMADDLMDAEDEGCDVISVRVDNYDDAILLGQNSHMANLPLSILSDSEEAMEFALMFCPGRNIIDSRSEMDEDTIRRLADWYGALIF